MVASGVSGVAHELAPSLDVRWIYIAFVGLIAAIDGWMVGIAAAVVGVVAYEAMIFRALPFLFERDTVLLGGAVAAIALGRGARAAVRPRTQLEPPPPRLLLTATNVDKRDVEDALRDALAEERSSRTAVTARVRELERQVEELRQRSRELDLVRLEAGETAAAVAELERMNAELRQMLAEQEPSLRAQENVIEELSRELRAVRSRTEEQTAEIEQLRRSQDEAEQERDAMERELVESTDALATLRSQIEQERSRVTMVEMDLAVALAQRDAARTAAAAENTRVAADAMARVAALESDLSSARAALDDQRVMLEAEWGEKLNTIVAHLASDHESDIGEAIMQREEARAEVRSLQMRIAELARQLEGRAAPAKKLLFVHRDAGVRAMTRHSLEANGYVVVTAADGLEALRLAIAEEPDLIIGEATMAKMDGRELAAFLKSRGETAGIRVVLLPLDAASDVQAVKASIASALAG
jgi:CheY-like chemotaxis protein